MWKLKIFFLLVCIIVHISDSSGQHITIIDEHINPGALLDEIPLKPAKTTDAFYLWDDWREGNIQLKDGREIKKYPIKYDLKSHRMEIRSPQGIKILGIEKISGFSFLDNSQEYINIDKFDNPDDIKGFLKVVHFGDVSLYRYTDSKILPANYVLALDTGRRFDKVVKENKFYFAKNEKIVEVSGNRNRVLMIFDHNSEVRQFVKKEKISLEDENDLVKLLSFYDSL